MTTTADRLFADVTRLDAALRRFLHGLPGVDQVGAERAPPCSAPGRSRPRPRPGRSTPRSRWSTSPRSRARTPPARSARWPPRRRRPDPADPTCPPVAAVCVYGDLVGVAREALGGSGVHVAAVATAFPSGRASLAVKLADVQDAVAAGADEIDMVIDRGAFLAGRYLDVFEEIVAVKEACGGAAPTSRSSSRPASWSPTTTSAAPRWLAMLAGADFIKTSTGKISPAATLPVHWSCSRRSATSAPPTGAEVGVKPAGGIRTTKDAIKHLVLVNETAGPDWLDPDWFRFGASSLLNDLLLQRQKLRTGHYSGPDYVTVD